MAVRRHLDVFYDLATLREIGKYKQWPATTVQRKIALYRAGHSK